MRRHLPAAARTADLEAFSLNPVHDSVGALPFQAIRKFVVRPITDTVPYCTTWYAVYSTVYNITAEQYNTVVLQAHTVAK